MVLLEISDVLSGVWHQWTLQSLSVWTVTTVPATTLRNLCWGPVWLWIAEDSVVRKRAYKELQKGCDSVVQYIVWQKHMIGDHWVTTALYKLPVFVLFSADKQKNWRLQLKVFNIS